MNLLIDGNPVKGIIILAHGAGMPMDHPFMGQLTKLLTGIDLQVVRFEFPYMAQRRTTGKKALPNKMPILIDTYQQVINEVASKVKVENLPLFIAGKSLGGRVATLIADHVEVNGVFVFGYPFHPVKKPQQLRVEHLADIQSKVQIFQGTRDPFGDELEVADYSLGDSVTVEWLEDGDHDLKPRKRSGFTQQDHLAKIVNSIALSVAEC